MWISQVIFFSIFGVSFIDLKPHQIPFSPPFFVRSSILYNLHNPLQSKLWTCVLIIRPLLPPTIVDDQLVPLPDLPHLHPERQSSHGRPNRVESKQGSKQSQRKPLRISVHVEPLPVESPSVCLEEDPVVVPERVVDPSLLKSQHCQGVFWHPGGEFAGSEADVVVGLYGGEM